MRKSFAIILIVLVVSITIVSGVLLLPQPTMKSMVASETGTVWENDNSVILPYEGYSTLTLNGPITVYTYTSLNGGPPNYPELSIYNQQVVTIKSGETYTWNCVNITTNGTTYGSNIHIKNMTVWDQFTYWLTGKI